MTNRSEKHAARRLLNRTEVAQHLGVRVETVSRWTTAGTIPCVRIGKRSVRYLLTQIVSQLRRRKEGGRAGCVPPQACGTALRRVQADRHARARPRHHRHPQRSPATRSSESGSPVTRYPDKRPTHSRIAKSAAKQPRRNATASAQHLLATEAPTHRETAPAPQPQQAERHPLSRPRSPTTKTSMISQLRGDGPRPSTSRASLRSRCPSPR